MGEAEPPTGVPDRLSQHETLPDNKGAEWARQTVLEESHEGQSLSDDVGTNFGGEHTDRDAEQTAVEPRLEAYFGPNAIQITAFVKAVKTAKVRRFEQEDIRAAEAGAAENDKEGSRLWQLLAHASSCDPISIWVWPFIRERIGTLVGAQVNLSQELPSRILDHVIASVSHAAVGENRQSSRRMENELRLAIAWLLERRNADVTDIANQVNHVLGNAGGDVEERVRRAVSVGSRAELQASIAAINLVYDQVRIAKHERVVERQERFDLKAAVNELRERTARDSEAINRLKGEKAELEKRVEEERTKRESDNRHHAHSSTQRQADVDTTMQRVRGLIADAADAVQIAMKRADDGSLRGLKAAERRIASAIEAMTGVDK
ncbi:hypothetical protein [Mesorhizobium sp. M0060]|uniref:hypothetical protein n=1 Tax=Mesorhizobium sp. M0060 TaxID=2956866 RepID=UPI00333B4FA7